MMWQNRSLVSIMSSDEQEGLKEYTLQLDYTVIIEQEDTKTFTVEAADEEEAFEKAQDQLWEEEGCDEIDSVEYTVLSERSSEPGRRDDKTVDMFNK